MFNENNNLFKSIFSYKRNNEEPAPADSIFDGINNTPQSDLYKPNTPILDGSLEFKGNTFYDVEDLESYCKELVSYDEEDIIPSSEEIKEMQYALSDLYMDNKLDLETYNYLSEVLEM